MVFFKKNPKQIEDQTLRQQNNIERESKAKRITEYLEFYFGVKYRAQRIAKSQELILPFTDIAQDENNHMIKEDTGFVVSVGILPNNSQRLEDLERGVSLWQDLESHLDPEDPHQIIANLDAFQGGNDTMSKTIEMYNTIDGILLCNRHTDSGYCFEYTSEIKSSEMGRLNLRAYPEDNQKFITRVEMSYKDSFNLSPGSPETIIDSIGIAKIINSAPTKDNLLSAIEEIGGNNFEALLSSMYQIDPEKDGIYIAVSIGKNSQSFKDRGFGIKMAYEFVGKILDTAKGYFRGDTMTRIFTPNEVKDRRTYWVEHSCSTVGIAAFNPDFKISEQENPTPYQLLHGLTKLQAPKEPKTNMLQIEDKHKLYE